MIDAEILKVDREHGTLTVRIEQDGEILARAINLPLPLRPDGSIDEAAVQDRISRYAQGRESQRLVEKWRARRLQIPEDPPAGRGLWVARSPRTIQVVTALDQGDVIDHVWATLRAEMTVVCSWGEVRANGFPLRPPFLTDGDEFAMPVLELPAGKGPRLEGRLNASVVSILFDSEQADAEPLWADVEGFLGAFAGPTWRETLVRDFSEELVDAATLRALAARGVADNAAWEASVGMA